MENLGCGSSSADAGVQPIAMALDPAGHLFVANQGSDTRFCVFGERWKYHQRL